ncbi:hypothetical protein Verru16b_00885 [Lacunisphaera limnophila]|uniref:Uncharacterized protein n=1 Tax=Lacunisphaera limnophila TaxID=1838286 RepID=A0A1D8ASF0_9BACT|nr:hypothetical protein [Lacunisphaera limnophila]AOS43827.1 hypothetical protein Verru16b_00885 [Lacunisphaera limnophila]
MNDEIIPSTYAGWRHCITVKCGIELSPAFVTARLAALNDTNDPHTRELRRLYGEAHHRNLLVWFSQAQRELGLA